MSTPTPTPTPTPAPDPAIRLLGEDAAAPWGAALRERAGRARRRAEARLGLTVDGTVWVRSFGNEQDFFNYLGARPTHVLAVARPSRREIVINRPAFFAENTYRQEQVLAHEMTHLIMGRRLAISPAGSRLPAWMDEGLAMMTAGEGDYDSSWRVAVAGTMGNLLPVEQLMNEVAVGGSNQDLAYAESLALTRYFIKQTIGGSGAANNPAPLAQALADPHDGPILLHRLWDYNYRIALEAQWRRTNRTLWSLLAVLSGSGVLWLVITLLFLAAYWRKRRMAQQMRERFAAEEDPREVDEAEWTEQPPPWEDDDDDK